ncbi:TPA: YopX family protein [Enterococcus hirae]
MIPKFRAWDRYEEVLKDQEGIYFGFLDHDDNLESLMLCLEERYALMQSTGLKDKNGVEIFEGDIVLISVDNGFDYLDNKKTVVQKSEFHSGLICKSLASGMEYRVFKRNEAGYDYEVVGNIYENPELLEEQR